MCYDEDRFIGDKELISKFLCCICDSVLCCPNSKQDVNEHKFCDSCIKNWLDVNKSCPICRIPLKYKELQPLYRIAIEILSGFKLHCKNKGCKVIETLELIEKHEAKCLFSPQKCKSCETEVKGNAHSEIECARNKYEKQIDELKSEVASLKGLIESLKNEQYKLIKENNELKRMVVNQEMKYLDKLENQEEIAIEIPQENIYGAEIVKLCDTKVNNFKKVKELIKQNANVNYSNVHGYSALICASLYGHFDIAKLLVERGANVNHKNNDGWNALMTASCYGHLEIVKLLVSNGAAVNEKDKNGWSALVKASDNDIKLYLLTHGAH